MQYQKRRQTYITLLLNANYRKTNKAEIKLYNSYECKHVDDYKFGLKKALKAFTNLRN